MSFLFFLLRLFAQYFAITFFRFRAFGTENLPRGGGMLLASNHQSFLDPIIIGLPIRGPYFSLARSSLFKNALFTRLITFLLAIPVFQGRKSADALRRGSELLLKGKTLVVFPEGTRTQNGSLGLLHGGIAFMAKRGRAPIIPTVIEGAFDIWPRGRKFFRLGSLMLAFGKPVYVTEESDLEEALQKVVRSMEELKTFLESLHT